jgi:Signal peptidase, peptidase S26
VDRTAFAWRAPRRWETVVFRCPQCASEWCVKRVVGLPGEIVALDGGDVLVNGQVARKALPEQQRLRQAVDVPGAGTVLRRTELGHVVCHTSARWLPSSSEQIEYHHHHHDSPITDESSYNQGAAPPANRVADIMLTFEARLTGPGQLVLTAKNQSGRSEAIVDFGQRELRLGRGDRTIARRPLSAVTVDNGRFAEWTFSLFDRHLLLAFGDAVVLAEPIELEEVSAEEKGPPLAISVRELTGEIRRVSVWRDAFYAVRHGDGRQKGARRDASVSWRLGPAEFFVLGDNAAISDDSRSWLSGPGLDAKLLIGKPLGVR